MMFIKSAKIHFNIVYSVNVLNIAYRDAINKKKKHKEDWGKQMKPQPYTGN